MVLKNDIQTTQIINTHKSRNIYTNITLRWFSIVNRYLETFHDNSQLRKNLVVSELRTFWVSLDLEISELSGLRKFLKLQNLENF